MPSKLQMSDILPEGVHGTAKLSHFEISHAESAFSKLRSTLNGRNDAVEPGKYVRLTVGNTLFMSDTQMEWRTSRKAVAHAKGRVLVGGLGLGMVTLEMHKPEVIGVWVIEKSPDVIALVEPHLQARLPPGWLTVIEGDVFTWKPPTGLLFDYCWMDIWPDICRDNLAEMLKLRRRFRRYMTKYDGVGGHIDCWGEAWLKAHQKRQSSTRTRMMMT